MHLGSYILIKPYITFPNFCVHEFKRRTDEHTLPASIVAPLSYPRDEPTLRLFTAVLVALHITVQDFWMTSTSPIGKSGSESAGRRTDTLTLNTFPHCPSLNYSRLLADFSYPIRSSFHPPTSIQDQSSRSKMSRTLSLPI